MAAEENTIATAYVQLVATTKGLQDNVTEAMGGAGTKSGGSFGKAFLTGAAGIIAAGASAITGAVTSLWGSATETAKAGDEIAKSSVKLGVTTDQYQALAFAAEHCGFEVGTLQTAQRSLMESGFEGSLYDAVNAVMELETAEERTALAAELFGNRSAIAMANLLQGDQTLAEFSAELESLGGIMSADAVQASASFEDALTNVNTAVQGAARSMLSEMLPGITQIMGGLADLFAGKEGAGEAISSGIDSTITALKGMIPKLTNLVSTLAPEILKGASELLFALADGLITELPEIMPTLVEVITGIADMLVKAVPKIGSVGMSVITSLVKGIGEALPVLIPDAVQAITDFIAVVLDNSDEFFEAAVILLEGLADGIVNALPVLIEALPSIIGGIVNFIESSTTAIVEAAAVLLLAMADAIPSVVIELNKVMPDIIIAVVEAIQEGAPQMGVAALELFGALLAAIPEIILQLVAAIPEVNMAILNSIKEGFPKLKESGLNAAGEFLSGLTASSVFAKIKDNVLSIVTKIKESFGGYFNTFVDIGKNIIQGLINGIKSMVKNVVSAVSDTANAIASSFKSFFGIASPSKLFFGFGQYIDQGLAKGLTAGEDSVTRAMDGVNAAIVGDYTTSANVAATGGMLARGEVNDGGIYGLIAEYLPYMQYLPQLANLRVVMDTGATVAQLAPQMDETLSRRAITRERFV